MSARGPKFKAAFPVHFDGKEYAPGERVPIGADAAAQLVNAGALVEDGADDDEGGDGDGTEGSGAGDSNADGVKPPAPKKPGRPKKGTEGSGE